MRDALKSPIVLKKLEQIAEQARTYPQSALTTLCHHINVEMLTEAFYLLKRSSAPGIDKVTWWQYKEQLEANLIDLYERLRSGRYKARDRKRVWLEKDGGKKRPIALTILEDKIVERAEVMLLEAVYEQDFLPFSYGFRPGRNQHQALKYLRDNCIVGKECWIVDVDLKGYFDSIDHTLLTEVIKKRVNDGGLLRLISKHLKAGVKDGDTIEYNDTGAPQGGVISPMVSNIFLHHVIDTWFEREVRPMLSGNCMMVRFADDILIKCESEKESRMVLEKINVRLSEYKLTANAEKTKIVRFCNPINDQNVDATQTFTFLGFTHYWGKTRCGGWTVKRRTMGKRLRRAKENIWEWTKKNNHRKLPDQQKELNAKLVGHYNYYGVRCNSKKMDSLYDFTLRAWLWWLRRRTSKHRLSWDKFKEKILSVYPLKKPRITVAWV